MLSYSKYFLLLLFCFFQFAVLTAQEESGPYHLSLKRELLYSGSGLVTTVGAHLYQQNLPPVLAGDLILPNLSWLDRIGAGNYTIASGNFSNQILFTSLGLPALFLADKKSRTDISTIGLLYLETMLINQGLTDLVKATTLRPRPYVFGVNFPPTNTLNSNDRASFLSGHASSTAAVSFFTARVFADYYPDSKLKPYVWGAAAGLPALMGYLRVRAGKHYPSDVLAGYVVGGAIGYLVPTLHKRKFKDRRLTLSPSLGGLYLNYNLSQ